MKAKFTFIGGLILLLSLGSCEVDEIETLDNDLLNSANLEEQTSFNNGMINTYSHDAVLKWGELISQSIDFKFPQPLEAKYYAMISLAIHDALNNVVPKYETYALDNSQVDVGDISKKNIQSIADAAVSQAARDILIQLYPPSTTAANDLLNLMLSEIEDSELKTRGIEIGKAAAAAVLAKRASDFPFGFIVHVGGNEPGEYQSNFEPFSTPGPVWPANAVYTPNLGQLTPFGILSGDQFRDEAQYPLNSSEYISDYNEVKSLGCVNCPLRSAEQTEIGAFWIENTASSMNRLARTLIVERKLDGWEAARLIGLVQMSQIDAYIASFEGKAFFNFWRPVTAIRAGDFDGVDATIGDPTWKATFQVPPTAEYPSTHAYNGGAAAIIFKSFFNSDQLNLDLISPYYSPGVQRHVKTFTQMSYENAISRIYIGYHFRHAIEVGERQGKELGEYVFDNNLREIKKIM